MHPRDKEIEDFQESLTFPEAARVVEYVVKKCTKDELQYLLGRIKRVTDDKG